MQIIYLAKIKKGNANQAVLPSKEKSRNFAQCIWQIVHTHLMPMKVSANKKKNKNLLLLGSHNGIPADEIALIEFKTRFAAGFSPLS